MAAPAAATTGLQTVDLTDEQPPSAGASDFALKFEVVDVDGRRTLARAATDYAGLYSLRKVQVPGKPDDTYADCLLPSCPSSAVRVGFHASRVGTGAGEFSGLQMGDFTLHLQAVHAQSGHLSAAHVKKALADGSVVRKRKSTGGGASGGGGGGGGGGSSAPSDVDITALLAKSFSMGGFPANMVNNPGFTHLMDGLGVTHLPHRTTVMRRQDAQHEEFIEELSALLRCAVEPHKVCLSTTVGQVDYIADAVCAAVDGWTNKFSQGDNFFSVAVSIMVEKTVKEYVKGTLTTVTTPTWQRVTRVIGFALYPKGVEMNAGQYVDDFDAVLQTVGLKLANVHQLVTDTASVMRAIETTPKFRLNQIPWGPCWQHVADLILEEVARAKGKQELPVWAKAWAAVIGPLLELSVFFTQAPASRMPPLVAVRKSMGKKPLNFQKYVITRFHTQTYVARRALILLPDLDGVPRPVMEKAAGSAAAAKYAALKLAADNVASEAKTVLDAIKEIVDHSPMLGAESMYTLSLVAGYRRRVLAALNGVPADKMTTKVDAIISQLRKIVMRRIPDIKSEPTGKFAYVERRTNLLAAAALLDPATAYSAVFLDHVRPARVEAACVDVLMRRLLPRAPAAPATPAAPAGPAKTAGATELPAYLAQLVQMGIVGAAVAAATAVPIPGMTAETSLRCFVTKCVHDQVSAFIVDAVANGEKWERECGDPFQHKDPTFRRAFWPMRRATYPALAQAAWFILSTMAANTSCERANSAARLISSHLRQSLTAKHLQQYLIEYMAYREQKLRRKREEKAVTDEDEEAEAELELAEEMDEMQDIDGVLYERNADGVVELGDFAPSDSSSDTDE